MVINYYVHCRFRDIKRELRLQKLLHNNENDEKVFFSNFKIFSKINYKL